MAAPYIYDPVIHTQSVSASTWTVVHNWGRKVNFQVYVGGLEVFPELVPVDDNSFQLKFYENDTLSAKTGYVIVN
jgi:hypothetical protein